MNAYQVKKFQNKIWDFYTKKGRNTLPWRKKITSYKIVVSEMMLQQTQVARVVGYFERWIEKYPTWNSLASASRKDVLQLWQGLGYNSRALRLHALARKANDTYKGRLPKDEKELLRLPGIGPYTKGAVRVFAFNIRDVFIETNIRTVFIHEFFKDKENIEDTTLLQCIENTLPKEKFREWYWALMDYGSYLKREGCNYNSKSKHYKKQTKFEGSKRQLRSGILKHLLKEEIVSFEKLEKMFQDRRLPGVLQELEKEDFIYKNKNNIFLKNT